MQDSTSVDMVGGKGRGSRDCPTNNVAVPITFEVLLSETMVFSALFVSLTVIIFCYGLGNGSFGYTTPCNLYIN